MARARSTAAEKNGPLGPQAWVAVALDALAAGGIEAVRVEPLAKALAVTKGSFYWHFADRRALIAAMLEQWSEGRITAIVKQAAPNLDAEQALRRLIELYTGRNNTRGLAIELAIRSLARNDAAAASAVHAVDVERLRLVSALYVRLGYDAPEAEARAVMLYAYLFGQSLLDRKSVKATDMTLSVEALVARPPVT